MKTTAAEVLEQASAGHPAAGVKELPVFVSVAGWQVPDDWTPDRMQWAGELIILRGSGRGGLAWFHLVPEAEVVIEP